MSDFQLTPDESLPFNQRFSDFDSLVGHTIRAVFDGPFNKHGEYTDNVVLVTETGCWAVLKAEADSCGEDAAIKVQRAYDYGTSAAQTLHDFVNAAELYTHGVINAGERDLLLKTEAELKAIKTERRANHLRQQLAELGAKA